ncbi:Ger(x)C family spore germination protein [Bacillus dakarensis]|uniref:Ger(x)C family spore germination protein n=1 Tax=Robertmurraya dakarensis TaxID=1926278 RepID=UPI00098195E5|nr:Ger(x)C family spore germination protein [Bacillus dakarensis]
MKRKCLLILVMVAFVLTGCWDSVELNDIAIVTGMAIDPGEDKKYRLTLEYMNPANFSKTSSQQGAPVSTMVQEGNSIADLAGKVNVGASRQLVFSHTRVLFINEKIAEEGILGFLDGLERSAPFRNDFNILITKSHKAEDYVKINNPLEKVPSLKLQKQAKSFAEGWGGDPKVVLSDFIDALISKGRNPVTNTVVLKGDPEKGSKQESNMSNGREALILFDGLAVFDNEKLAGYLSLDDSRNYMWTQDLKQTTLTFPCHDHGDSAKEKQYVNVRVPNSRTKMETYYRNEQPVLKVNIYTEAQIIETQCSDDLTKIDTFKKLEKNAEKYIEESVGRTISKTQKEYGVDIFGFGEALYRQDYKKFKDVEDDWNKEFARAEVVVSAKVQIRRAGTKSKSFLTELSDGMEE